MEKLRRDRKVQNRKKLKKIKLERQKESSEKMKS